MVRGARSRAFRPWRCPRDKVLICLRMIMHVCITDVREIVSTFSSTVQQIVDVRMQSWDRALPHALKWFVQARAILILGFEWIRVHFYELGERFRGTHTRKIGVDSNLTINSVLNKSVLIQLDRIPPKAGRSERIPGKTLSNRPG